MISGAGAVRNSALALGQGLWTRRGWPPSFLWVPAVLIGVAISLPLVYLVVRTLGVGTGVWDLVFRMRTLEILGRTILLTASVTWATVIIAVPIAWLTVRSDLPLRRLWAVLTALPLAIPSYVGALVVIAALGPRGLVQQMLAGLFGVERIPEIYGFPGAALTLAFLSYPYVMLSVRGALWGLDPTLEEAARGLGHGRWGTYRRVILPLLRPSIAAGALLVALYTLSDIGAVSLLGYETFTWVIYLEYDVTFDRALAAALSLLLVVLALGVLVLEARARGRSPYYRSGTRVLSTSAPVGLGRWRWPAFAFCSLIVAVTLALPVAVLGYWLARGLAGGPALSSFWGPMMGSLYASSLAALSAVVVALPLAIMATRYAGRLSRVLEGITYSSFALPGIVIALALVFFTVRFAIPLYQSFVILIFAYVLLFLAPALGAVKASLLQVTPRVEEAARTLGAGPWQVFRRVTLPLVRPGVLSAGALVFLITMKELPATLILGPIGFKTLATSVWSATSGGHFAQAAAPALLLVLASSAAMAFLILQEHKPTYEGVAGADAYRR